MSPATTILTEPPGVVAEPARRDMLEVLITYAVEATAAAARLGIPRPHRAGDAPGRLTLRLVGEADGKGRLDVALSFDGAERRIAAFPRVLVARAQLGGLLHIDAADPCSSRRLLALTIDTATGRALFTRSEAPTLADLPGGVYEAGVVRVVDGR